MAKNAPIIDAEEWRDVVGYEGIYQVSSLGRVKSFAQFSDGRILTRKAVNTRGYMMMILCRDGEKEQAAVHRLVCRAFNGAPPKGHIVAHNNGKRSDNRAKNLRWATYKENFADRLMHGTYPAGSSNPCSKLDEEAVREIRAHPNTPLPVFAEKFGVDRTAIWKVRHRKTWTHI